MHRVLIILCCVLINSCHGTQGAGIWLEYAKNEEKSQLAPEPSSVTIEYNDKDIVDLICSTTDEAKQNGKEPYLSWIEGAKPSPIFHGKIHQKRLLHTNDDGTELICNAVSYDGTKTWRITISFVLINSGSMSFSMLLMVLGGLILTAVIAIITYGVVYRCKNRKRVIKCGTKDAPVEDEVKYSEILKRQKIFGPTKDDHTVEVGIDNLSCIHENLDENDPSYVKFDSPDKFVSPDSRDVVDESDNDRIKNAIKNYDRNVNSVRVNRNRYSSTDC